MSSSKHNSDGNVCSILLNPALGRIVIEPPYLHVQGQGCRGEVNFIKAEIFPAVLYTLFIEKVDKITTTLTK